LSDYFLIAKIISAYNFDGYLNLFSYSDFPERFAKLDTVFIDVFGDKRKFFVEETLELQNNFAIKFKNFDSEQDTDFLIGKKVFVLSGDEVKLDNDVYFIHDLVGSKVIRNNKFFGYVKEVFQTPANDVFVIENDKNKEILIPDIKDYILSFDQKNRILVLVPGEESFYDDD